MSDQSSSTSQQPEHFVFTDENEQKIESILAKYPETRRASAVMSLLYIAQNQILEQTGMSWIPTVAMDVIAQRLGMAPVRVYEVANFYTMFNTSPVGRYHLQVCRTTTCWLRGSNDVVEACKKATGIEALGQTSADGQFTLSEVECLGACANAPILQVNNDYFEDLNTERTTELIERLKKGEPVTPGSTIGRLNSSPEEGLTTLMADATSHSDTHE